MSLLSRFGVTAPGWLWLLPLALLPLAATAQRRVPVPALAMVPADGLSRLVDAVLTLASVAGIGFLVLALAGPRLAGESVVRTGEGAQVSLLIDRSGSMNETFAGRQPSGAEESKAAASRRILEGFVGRRAHDLVAVSAFSTSPMAVLPMTDRHDAVRAAIRAIDRPGLEATNVARGLGLALSQFGPGAPQASRVLLLVSDGAAVIDRRVQPLLREEFAKIHPTLYWLFLRTAGSPGLADRPAGEDTPQAAPERHLDLFFKSLGVPYRAFEAESPEAVEQAVREIDRLERKPITYVERRPQHDLAGLAYGLAAFALGLLLAGKLAETDLAGWKAEARRSVRPSEDPASQPTRRAA
ncbi:von Willebrand factor A [Methylobacterium indicum]|uniref:von Willebrand factor A n=1 Tax=Methylobacterium indicum TaxID=1775910 RepID=A0ABR5HGT7_9HYPH|nr:vWA domain-containing protein [Methylobacterium indicum]KMO10532.1 von Willebrand factor A [Methylobacterium indicum]KMO25869.1 von Willebrand factor A [Methylobacterium indicum]KTS19368.1 von Willebrand factor A [Methylobacterium indicum]KTS34716.1 von Willebrand factor A [Methylobacterium indicum]KTS46316.1 von Willebrand factor A [Methylobacterium indicum]